MRSLRLLPTALAIIALGLVSCLHSQPQASGTDPVRFYVDPAKGSDRATGTSPQRAFKSLERARDAARAVPRPLRTDIEIVLAGGDYRLAKPFALTAADGGNGTRRVRYRAAEGAEPRLSGGISVTNWALHDRERNIHRAVLAGPVETRQLFVNDRRATRARSIGGITGIKRVGGGYILPPDSDLGSWKNPQDIEFVYRHIWTNPRAGIATIEQRTEGLMALMDQPGFDNGRNKGWTSVDIPWFVENAYELLDEPGEWYLDRTGSVGGKPYTLYYKPYDWENMATARFVVPVLEQLITVDGANIESAVTNLTFEGITFLHTTWLRPSTEYGLPDAQNNVMRENFAKFGKTHGDQESIIDGAALRLRYARSIEVLRSRFLHLGGIGLCFATAGASDNRIEGNTFLDISANAIQIGEYVGWETPGNENVPFPENPALRVERNRIANNYIYRAAVEYRSAIPIGITFPRDSQIVHNEVYHAPYSGVHLGWVWERAPKTAMGNNLIEWNRLQNTMVELADGAAFYVLGPNDPDHTPTILRNNWLKQTRWGHGFYFDESSSRQVADGNLFEQIGDGIIKMNGRTNRDITVTGIYADKERNQITGTIKLGENGLSVEATRRIQQPENAEFAARIRAGAGLQPEFASARYIPSDRVINELEEGEVELGAYVTNGMDKKPTSFGYTGMGFVDNLARRSGASATVTVNVSKGGTYQLRLRYSAPGKPVAGLRLAVNGVERDLPELPASADHNLWSVHVESADLKPGLNTLRFSCATPHNGVFFADRVDMVRVP